MSYSYIISFSVIIEQSMPNETGVNINELMEILEAKKIKEIWFIDIKPAFYSRFD